VDALELVRLNLLSPMILAFALGIVATLVRSDLRLPDALYSALSIYLLLAIGLKGGVALRATPLSEIAGPALVTLLAGALIPLWTYPIARRLGGWGVADSAALAAHYGSVSVVTFVAAQAFLDRAGVPYEGFLATLLALLEVPAILVALLFRTLDAFRIFDTVYVQTRGAQGTETVSVVGYETLMVRLNLGLGSAVSVLIFLCVVAIAWLFVKGLGLDLARRAGP